jgi:PleD family two-component response regulator
MAKRAKCRGGTGYRGRQLRWRAIEAQDIFYCCRQFVVSFRPNADISRGTDPESGRRQKGGLHMTHTDRITAAPVQKVLVVNGSTEVLGMLETVLDAGRYDMVFVESSDRAYSQIKKVRPDLVILCARIDRLDGFQLLTMLKLDPETRDLPVLTYTTEYEGQDFDTAISQLAEDEEAMLPTRPALRMN